MAITRVRLEQYENDVAAAVDDAATALEKSLSAIDLSALDAGMARDYIEQVLIGVNSTFGDVAATHAADLYDETALAEGRRDLTPARLYYGATEAQLAADAAHMLHMWQRGEDFAEWAARRMEGYIRRAANNTQKENARRGPGPKRRRAAEIGATKTAERPGGGETTKERHGISCCFCNNILAIANCAS